MNARLRAPVALVQAVPLAALLGVSALPLLFLAVRFAAWPAIDLASLWPALRFAAMGAAVAAIVGGAFGALAGTLDVPGRRAAIGLGTLLLAAPPAFWWIGLTRLHGGFGSISGVTGGSAVAGVALAPITLLLVLAAAREIPSNVYQAARLTLDPVRRIRCVLLPLLRPALTAGFLLTLILLLGESEIPFLFGFRTSMTDIVTTFSQTFAPDRTLPLVVPLLVVVIVLALFMAKALFAVLVAAPAPGRGVIRRSAGVWMAIGLLPLPALAASSLAGYGWAFLSTGFSAARRVPADLTTVSASIAEPVLCALVGVALAIAASYPVRRSAAIRPLMLVSLLLSCVPAAIVALGWVGVSLALGRGSVAPAVAHVVRAMALPSLAFLVAYSRLPPSFEQAARLVPLSSVRRAWTLMLPMLASSIVAASAMTAALIFADRDVASLLLAPGESRLMLNLYLLSANAPSAVVGGTALVVCAAGALVIATAALVPFMVLRSPRG